MKSLTVLYASVICVIGMLSVGAMAQTEPPELKQFYLAIPPMKFYSRCVESETDLFAYLVGIYGESESEEVTFSQANLTDLPEAAGDLKNFTVAVIMKPTRPRGSSLTYEDLLQAQYEADLSCINQPTGCMARTSVLKQKQYCMIAANPGKSTQLIYLACTYEKYTISKNITLEQEKLRSGAPPPRSEPYYAPIGFEPAVRRVEGAKGDGSNLKFLITDANQANTNNAHFGSTSFLFILLITTVLILPSS